MLPLGGYLFKVQLTKKSFAKKNVLLLWFWPKNCYCFDLKRISAAWLSKAEI